MRHFLRSTFITTFALIACATSSMAGTIREIRVTGAERIEPATVLSYLELKKGDEATQEALDSALKGLFATGLFADVNLSETDGVVTVQITENPVINQIAFEGNKELKNDELQAEIQLRQRQVFTRTKVQEDVSRLYELYRRKGQYSAEITPKIIKLDQNRVNLVFEISEGDVTDISSIRFIGNQRFSDNELRGELASAEHRWYNFLTTNDRFDQDRFAFDQEKLRQFYLKEGYADFKILSAVSELSQDKKDFFITITVDEGPRYKVGDIRINSQIKNLDPTKLSSVPTLKVGDWYNAEDVKTSVDKMTKTLGDMQYAFVTVVPDAERNHEKNTIDLIFNINESPRVFVERIDIDGNVRTMDKVIRRQMQLSEGDPFNKSKLQKSEQDIKDLGYFEKVDVKTLPGSAPDKTVLDVNVAEQSTGELSVGAGFSTSDGPLADFRIREKNLLGKGQDLSLASTIAGKRTEFDLSFTEPYFMDRDLAAGVDLFHITRDQQNVSSYDQKRTGGGLRLGYPLSENLRQTLRYRIENNEITNAAADASRFIKDQTGTRVTSAISQHLAYDDLDSKLFPTDGYSLWLDTELAGLGGDAKYVSGKVGASYYYPIAKDWDVNILGETGAIGGTFGEDVKINERYFIGSNTFRGFQRSGIGPRDSATGDALGGNYFYRGTAELSFPLGFPEDMGIAGHAFNDIGSEWSIDDANQTGVQDVNSLRASAGLGASWRSPFGPVRIDLAQPYVKEKFDKTEAFRFSFGTRF